MRKSILPGNDDEALSLPLLSLEGINVRSWLTRDCAELAITAKLAFRLPDTDVPLRR